jgi:hypothetical protein
VGLRTRSMVPTCRLEAHDVERIKPFVAKSLCRLSDDELGWLGFWMVVEGGSD